MIFRQIDEIRTGRTYPIIPKRGQKAIPDTRILIKDIREEPVQAISEADAAAEGVNEYRELWDSIHGHMLKECWQANPDVFVYEFDPVEKQ